MKTVRVKVKYFSFFQDITGKTEEYMYLHNPTVVGLVALLEEKYRTRSGRKPFPIRPSRDRLECMIVVNGKSADLTNSLQDRDEVMLMQPMGGG